MTRSRRSLRVLDAGRWTRPGSGASRCRGLRALAAGVVVLGALSGCGGSDDTASPTVPAATAPVPAGVVGGADPTGVPVATQVETGELVWATAVEPGTNRPTAEVTEFPVTAPVIYAAIPVSAAPPGATLRAEWAYGSTPIQGVAASVQIPEVGGERIWVEFHLERQVGDSWPDGRYTVTVREGDRVVGEGTVDVVPE